MVHQVQLYTSSLHATQVLNTHVHKHVQKDVQKACTNRHIQKGM
jgi:cytochrome c-type biogenesis protein CcmE